MKSKSVYVVCEGLGLFGVHLNELKQQSGQIRRAKRLRAYGYF